jgi:hypothetical protein
VCGASNALLALKTYAESGANIISTYFTAGLMEWVGCVVLWTRPGSGGVVVSGVLAVFRGHIHRYIAPFVVA